LKAIVIGVIGAILGCLLGWLIDSAHALPANYSTQANNTDALYTWLLIVTGGIFGLVTAVLIAALVLFRKKRGEERTSSPVHGHTMLEVVWTIIPTIIVVFFTALSWHVLNENESAQADPNRMIVTVTGFQWDWKYTYNKEGLKDQHQLVVPINTPIEFEVTSTDVIHGWWVPEWRVQMNATPGQTNIVYATPDRLGTVSVVCTFICGDGHPKMGTEVAGAFPARIKIVSDADFKTWMNQALSAQKAALSNPTGQAAAVFKDNGCNGCHTWTPAGATGTIGPNLDNVAADAQKAGQGVAAYVKQSIVDPGAYVVPGYPAGVMPTDYGTKISAADLDKLVVGLSSQGQ
jgi:cytochrome c oxidase subunit 2